ncbi:MAG: response regulator transcription factor [Bauldia sp.]|nr:response regulator transcription factor [Bauldia sp.]
MTEPRGRPPHPDVLTPAEWHVLNLVRHGLSNRRIAELRETSLDATKFHVASILSKLDADDRAALRGWTGMHTDSPLEHDPKKWLPILRKDHAPPRK